MPINYPIIWNVWLIPVAGVVSFVGFRLGVYNRGVWWTWYSSEKGAKRLVSMMLIKIFRLFGGG